MTLRPLGTVMAIVLAFGALAVAPFAWLALNPVQKIVVQRVSFDAAEGPADSQRPPGAARSRFVDVSPALLRDGFAAGELNVALFDDTVVGMVLGAAEIHEAPGEAPIRTLSGGLTEDPNAVVTVLVQADSLHLDVVGARSFRIVPVAPPLHRIDELDPATALPLLAD